MPPPEKVIGIIGKTNVGKSTLFSALTLATVKIANHPFTTIEPNIGVGYVRKKCIHVELGLEKCNPRTGYCLKGFRFIPIKLLDVAGLVPGASRGRGLGNKFMDDLRQADALIHVVDAAGSTDLDGNPVKPGSIDPVEEVKSIQNEVDEWFFNVVYRIWVSKISKHILTIQNPIEYLTQNLSGLSISKNHVVEAIENSILADKNPRTWSTDDIRLFAINLRRISKPIIIAANKSDIPIAEDNIKRLIEFFGERNVVPVSALAEYILRKAALNNYIDYLPGDSSFKIIDGNKLTSDQMKALQIIEENVLNKYGSTGVQELINRVVFSVLKLIVVYPVENPRKFSDHSGNVLPDAYLVSNNTKARELAYMIHTDLGNTFLYAINVKTGEKLSENYVLRDDDVIKIVATASH
ncbi:MAG: redox-regulated ATPase YchF [Desulfurococcaceae archaeon]